MQHVCCHCTGPTCESVAMANTRQPMGSSACRFRRPISGKHVAAGNGRTFQMAQRHSISNYRTTEITIASLDALFTSWGLPKTLVSDNGHQFPSAEFANWCRSNDIVHMTSTPFHPPSNRETERLVGMSKKAIQGSVGKKATAREFLRDYRSTPHSTTGIYGQPFSHLIHIYWYQ